MPRSKKVRKAPQAEPSRAALLGATIARRPREFVCGLMAAIASGWIFTNALFLQTGPHPAPIFAAPKPPVQTAAPLPPQPPRAQPVQTERMRAQPANVR